MSFNSLLTRVSWENPPAVRWLPLKRRRIELKMSRGSFPPPTGRQGQNPRELVISTADAATGTDASDINGPSTFCVASS